MTQYISPFTILGINPSQNIDKQAINLAKKKFLAEIDLSPMQTIWLGGEEMTKNDVLNFFEKIQNTDDDWRFHAALAEQEALLDFLKNKSYGSKSKPFESDYQFDDNFKQKISPYLADAFSTAINKNIRRRKYKNIALLFEKIPRSLILKEDWSNAIDSIQNVLFAEERKFIELFQKSPFSTKSFFSFYSYDFLKTLNILAKNGFDWIVDAWANRIYNFAGSFWEQNHTEFARLIVERLVFLECSPEIKEQIEQRNTTYSIQLERKTFEEEQDTSNDSDSNCLFYIFGFICLVCIYLVMSSNSVKSLKNNVKEDAPVYLHIDEVEETTKPKEEKNKNNKTFRFQEEVKR